MKVDPIIAPQRELLKIVGDLCGSRRPKKSQLELFHYTDLQGFVGIVSSQSLWASDMLCLEDASEASYGYGLFKKVLNRDFASMPRTHRELFLKTLVEGEFQTYAPFVACFCEQGDLLSQWRGYGGKGEGLALAFDIDWLSSLLSSGFALRQVLYRRGDQEELISQYLQGVAALTVNRKSSAENARWIWELAAGAAADIIVVTKDPRFAEEREWRLINPQIVQGRKFKYRRSGSRVVPYVPIQIKEEGIAGVIRGPHFAGTDARGIRQMLLYGGFPNASRRVRDSKVPIRR